MLNEEVEKYTKLTGEDGWKTPIMRISAYFDGYDKGQTCLKFSKIVAKIVILLLMKIVIAVVTTTAS